MPTIKLQSEHKDLDKYKNIYDDIFYCKKNRDLIHNPYGAAVIYKSGTKSYYVEGKLHRLDGPAVIYPNGEVEYYINGKELSKEEFEIEKLKILGKEHLICLL